MALLSVLLFLFYVSYFLGELARIRIINAVTIGPIDLVLVVLFIYWTLKIKKNKSYFLKKPIIIFILVAFFSLIINVNNFSKQEMLVSSLYLLRWLLYSSVYFIFRDIGEVYGKKISKFSTLSSFMLVIAGILQLLAYPSLRGMYYLGWDEHLNRIFSTFLDPNFTGVIFVLFFIFVFVLKEKIFKNNKKLAFMILSITFVGIILTYSRGAFLMLISSALFYSFINKNKKILVSTIISVMVVFLVLLPGFYLENTNLLRTNSTIERIGTSVKALQIFKNNPMGVGFNTYRYAREKYGEKDLSVAGPSHSGAGVDNSFIFILVTGGVFGLFSFVYLLIKMLKLGMMKKNNGYGTVLVLSLVGLTIDSLTINSLFYSFIMLWVWSLAGLTESN